MGNTPRAWNLALQGLFVSMFMLMFAACHKEGTFGPWPASVDLLYPANGDTTAFCCFSFAWSSSAVASDYRLVLSKSPEFTTTIVDTVTSDLTYALKSALNPGGIFYWKVSSPSIEAESHGSIVIRDYIAKFVGEYKTEVSIKHYLTPTGYTEVDSTYMGTAVVTQVGPQTIKIAELVSGYLRIYDFTTYLSTDESHINFMYNDVSRTSFCVLNYIDGRFSASIITGGLAFRDIYFFSGSID